MKPTMNKQIVQMASGQFPKILFLTTLSNHYDILGRCRSFEEMQQQLKEFCQFFLKEDKS